MSNSLRLHGLQSARLLCPGDFPGKNIGVGVGSHSLLQGIFPTQGWNAGLLHWQVGSLPLCPPGKPVWAEDWYYSHCRDGGTEAQLVGEGARIPTPAAGIPACALSTHRGGHWMPGSGSRLGMTFSGLLQPACWALPDPTPFP